MYSEKQLKKILDDAIDKTIQDIKQRFEETIITEFNSATTLHRKFNLVMDFIDSVDYDINNSEIS